MSGKLYSVEDVTRMFEDDNFDLIENVEDNHFKVNKGHVVGNLIDNVTDIPFEVNNKEHGVEEQTIWNLIVHF